MEFIKEVAEAGYPREATSMLTGAAVPRLTHILKPIQKNLDTMEWIIRDMDAAHLST